MFPLVTYEFKAITSICRDNKHSHNFLSPTQMEKIFSHAWRGRHGCESQEELEQLQERQKTPEEIQGQFIDDDQVFTYYVYVF